jgi:hypothetical protein
MLIAVVDERAAERGINPRVAQRPDTENRHLHDRAELLSHAKLEQGLRDGTLDVAGGTAWLWSREQFAGSVDTLFVDEAGQMSLADVLSVAGAARNLVLVGDPQ